MCAWMAACPAAQYEDVSNEHKYVHLIGKKYATLAELVVHGINYDKDFKKVTQEYVVTNKPGMAGRGVVERGLLRPGATVTVHKVLECTSCSYSSIKYIVSVEPPLPNPTIPISLESIGKESVVIDTDGRVTMNPALFVAQ